MSTASVLTAVMTEAAIDVPGLTWGLGHREASKQHVAPRAVWVPVRGAHRGPQQGGTNPRPIANRWVTYTVRCVGVDATAAESIMSAVVRALHLTLTRGGYELGGEEWPEVGVGTVGDIVLLTVSIGLPILDRAAPTARALTVSTPGDLT